VLRIASEQHAGWFAVGEVVATVFNAFVMYGSLVAVAYVTLTSAKRGGNENVSAQRGNGATVNAGA